MPASRRARQAFQRLPITAALTTLVALAAGCAPAPAPAAAAAPAAARLDALAAPERSRPAPAGAPEALAPARIAAQAAPPAAGRGGSGSSQAPSREGVLTVDLHGFVAALRPAGHRQLLSTVADIASITLTILQDGQTSASATLTQADIANDAVTRTFTGLATGNAVVLVVAYDAQGVPIGSASQVVVISAAGTSVANLPVQLVSSSPAPGPGNTLSTTLTFSPASGTVLAAFPMAYHNLLAAGDGYLYSEGIIPTGNQPVAFLHRSSPTDGTNLQMYLIDAAGPGGTLHGIYPLAYNPVSHSVACGAFIPQDIVTQPGDTSVTVVRGALRARSLMVDAAGVIYHPRAGSTLEAFAGGTSQATNIPCYSAADLDTAGNFWTNVSQATPPAWPAEPAVHRYAPDGTLLGAYALPFSPEAIQSDRAGGVWVADQGTQIVHVAADGTLGTPLTATINDFCVDESGNLWLAEGTALTKVWPDGTLAGTFPIAAREVTAGFGYVFAGSYVPPAGQPSGNYVYKVAP